MPPRPDCHPVDAADQLVELALGADHRFHFRVRGDLDRIQCVDIEGIRHGDFKETPLLPEWRHLEFCAVWIGIRRARAKSIG